jgi:hypothetical protein
MSEGLVLVGREDHRRAIVSDLDVCFALRLIVNEWSWSTITMSPGAIPHHLTNLRDKIRVFVLPERRSDRVHPRAVKIKMSNYARKRPAKSSSRTRAK